jgi:hypothetical protein
VSKGARPGLVTYDHEQTIHVTPRGLEQVAIQSNLKSLTLLTFARMVMGSLRVAEGAATVDARDFWAIDERREGALFVGKVLNLHEIRS